jgi:thiol-disulfide isomerase/thioredoxin
VPPLPTLPPSVPPPGGGRSSAAPAGRTSAKLALVDPLERPWSLDSVTPGSLVLAEFMSSSCVHCKQSIPILKDLQSRYGASGFQVVGVLCDNQPQQDRIATAAKYARDNNLNYALYVEQGSAGSNRDKFNVENYPHVVLLDSTGRLLWQGHPGEKTKLESAIQQNLPK